MAKAVTIDPSHHAVQLVQREGFICVICTRCTCCHPDRMDKECRTPNFAKTHHLAGLQSVAPTRPGHGDFDNII